MLAVEEYLDWRGDTGKYDDDNKGFQGHMNLKDVEDTVMAEVRLKLHSLSTVEWPTGTGETLSSAIQVLNQ